MTVASLPPTGMPAPSRFGAAPPPSARRPAPAVRFGSTDNHAARPERAEAPPPEGGLRGKARHVGSRMHQGFQAMMSYFTPADWRENNYVKPGTLTGDLLLGTLAGLVLSLPTLGAGAVATVPAMVGTLVAFNLITRFLFGCAGKGDTLPHSFVGP